MPTNNIEWIWWLFSTIILATIINIASSYFKDKVDVYLESYSSAVKLRNTKEKELMENAVSNMIQDPQFVHYHIFLASTELIIALFAWCLGIFFLICAAVYLLTIPALIQFYISSGLDSMFKSSNPYLVVFGTPIVFLALSILLVIASFAYFKSATWNRRVVDKFYSAQINTQRRKK